MIERRRFHVRDELKARFDFPPVIARVKFLITLPGTAAGRPRRWSRRVRTGRSRRRAGAAPSTAASGSGSPRSRTSRSSVGSAFAV